LCLLDVKVKVEAATQLRDNLEHYITGAIYPAFLKKLVPIFINCLNGPPVFVSTSAEQVRIFGSGRNSPEKG
jgi:transformation/transcription domain-associated protein